MLYLFLYNQNISFLLKYKNHKLIIQLINFHIIPIHIIHLIYIN